MADASITNISFHSNHAFQQNIYNLPVLLSKSNTIPHKMGSKRKRPQRVPVKRREPPRWKRTEIKRARVKELLEKGLTKDDMDERRERYECMKEHPGRYCRECNPRTWEEKPERCSGDNSDGDSEEDDLSHEEADLSDSWSDHTQDSLGAASLTYSEVWDEEAEVNEMIIQKDEVIEFLKGRVAHVDDVARRLETQISTEKSAKPPIGNLRGRWNLYNLEACPKTWDSTEEYFVLCITELATEGPLLPRSYFNEHGRPLESYMQLQIRYESGGIVPFQLPTNASLNPIPITYVGYQDMSAEIMFLGSDCLRLKVPRTLLRDRNGRIEKGTEMVEFVGTRHQRKKKHLIERPGSPRGSGSMAASLLGDRC